MLFSETGRISLWVFSTSIQKLRARNSTFGLSNQNQQKSNTKTKEWSTQIMRKTRKNWGSESKVRQRNRCHDSEIIVWHLIQNPKFFWSSSVFVWIILFALCCTFVDFSWKVRKWSFSLSIFVLKSKKIIDLFYLFQKTTYC